MMPGNLFRLQLAAALGDRRQMVLRVGISLLLSLPFIFVGMQPRAQAAGITMVILFTSFFGAAVSHAHLRADQRLARLSLLPISRGTLWLDLALSSTLMRLGPSAIVLAAFVVVSGHNVTAGMLLNLAGLLCGALVLLTLLGMGVGRLARSNAEVHLFGTLATGMLALLSGVAPLPGRLLGLTAIMAWNPIAWLLSALNRLATGFTETSRAELIVSWAVLTAVVATAGVRWISGGACGRRFNARGTVDDRTYMEVQTK